MGMLLLPQRDKSRLDPVPDGGQTMDTCMAGSAKGDQKAALMNRELTVSPTRLTAVAIAI
jgi:hypothetical protein